MKSAKELKERAVFKSIMPYYKFTPNKFDQFCKQHAKEQREYCANKIINDFELYRGSIWDVKQSMVRKWVESTPEPEL